MKRIAAWIGGAAGAAFGYRLLRRRQDEAPGAAPQPATEPDARADELRAKLAEARAEEAPTAEPSAPESLEDRRRRVHEQGRAAIDEMES